MIFGISIRETILQVLDIELIFNIDFWYFRFFEIPLGLWIFFLYEQMLQMLHLQHLLKKGKKSKVLIFGQSLRPVEWSPGWIYQI